jgi:hypothetical protein
MSLVLAQRCGSYLHGVSQGQGMNGRGCLGGMQAQDDQWVRNASWECLKNDLLARFRTSLGFSPMAYQTSLSVDKGGRPQNTASHD